ncbi:hypothetical protein Acor_26450 [Acrocarpospora corrugata]|uniref:HTH luxR-type domain-containing protein n=1 Tax=Acrocarpospora corrugata TaxID=35763 RepID=A0A5M3W0E5_9ACTN|nr:LuxR C-terminal-related transcriptional regulator [Acrocarpospora corrugata]GES00581.1 hypothetical protein Acor_26450 [Acrocarpospora corrugata]
MADSVGTLSERELTVLSLIGAGSSVKHIAAQLGISASTVEGHKRRLYQKLGVTHQSQAVSQAITLGLFKTPPKDRDETEMVVVHARPGAPVDRVTQALLGHGRPFVLTPELDPALWRWRGRFITVLMDPAPHDWLATTKLRAPVVVIPSVRPGDGLVQEAMRYGARALVWLEDVPDLLCTTLAMVAHGYVIMAGTRLPAGPSPELSARERDILDSIATGHTLQQTARSLGISVKTVENTQGRLFRKLGARNRPEALTNAYRQGLVPG